MKKSIAALLTALFIIAQICTAFATDGVTLTFDQGYTAGDVNGQNGWTVSGADNSTCYAYIAEDPTDSTNQCLKVWDSSGSKNFNATYEFGAVTGKDGIATVEFKWLTGNNEGYKGGIKIMSGTNMLAQVTRIYANSKCYFTLSNETNSDNITLGEWLVEWPSQSVWYTFKLVFDFTGETKTYDVYHTSDGIMPETPTKENIPFAMSATSINKINLFTNWGDGKTQYYFDDISIFNGDGNDPAQPTEYAIADNSAKYSLGTNDVTVTADITKGENSAVIVAVAYNNDNRIIGTDTEFAFNGESYSKTFRIGDETVSDVKIYIWQSFGNCKPICSSSAEEDTP